MTKLERNYLRSIWIKFNDNFDLYKSLTTSEMSELLKFMRVYHKTVLEVLSLGDDQDDTDLKELFEDNKIEIVK